MEPTVFPEVENAIADIARRHGLSREAVLAMLWALHVGGGTMAQFSIPELGGSGQWMQDERGSVTLGGRRVPITRPRVRAADGSGEVAIASYELFSSTELLGKMALGGCWPACRLAATRSGWSR